MAPSSKTPKQIKRLQAAPSSPGHLATPPESPTQAFRANVITSDHVQPDSIKPATEGLSEAGPVLRADPSVEKKIRIRASKIEYKTVNEVYNKDIWKYEIRESSQTSTEQDDEYEEYIFTHRHKFDSSHKYEASFVDVKSTTLRDILWEVLNGVTCVSLREDKPAIKPDVLFAYLPDLEEYRTKNAQPDSTKRLQLDTLIEFLKVQYASTSEKLRALMKHGEITFDLLPVFFRPNSIVYTHCATSEQPRCLRFDSGRTKSLSTGKGFQMNCRYFTNDGKTSGVAGATAQVSEFEGVIKITSLGVYPLEHHATKDKIIQELIERGRKSIGLSGTYCRAYNGMAFYRVKDEVKKFPVDGRVMVDPVLFREKNPDYSFPAVMEKPPYPMDEDLGFCASTHVCSPWDDFEQGPSQIDGEITKPKTSYTDEDLLLCKPTVFGFSLSIKHWAEFAVAELKEFRWSPLAFDSVVIPKDNKDIIQALVKGHTTQSNSRQFVDVIRGKGQSLAILLQYSPSLSTARASK